jgi:hypothetical protein
VPIFRQTKPFRLPRVYEAGAAEAGRRREPADDGDDHESRRPEALSIRLRGCPVSLAVKIAQQRAQVEVKLGIYQA